MNSLVLASGRMFFRGRYLTNLVISASLSALLWVGLVTKLVSFPMADESPGRRAPM